jgi:hypothetical protein
MLTPTQLETPTTAELEALADRIDGELTKRELEKWESEAPQSCHR